MRRTRPIDIEAEISSLAPGGHGVAHFATGGERRAVFVPQSAPGDRARLEVDASRRPARGRIRLLLAPGPDRVAPPCPWAAPCGACDWMHLSLDAQRAAHLGHLRAALPAAWRDVPIASFAAPQELGYRMRTRVHVRCARDGRAIVGMHGPRTNEPVEVQRCIVLDGRVEEARRAIAPILTGSRGRGEVQIALGETRLAVFEIQWTGQVADASFARLERALEDGTIGGAQVATSGARRPARVGDPTPWTTGGDGAPLRLAVGGFAQANERMNEQLAAWVAQIVHPWAPRATVELFAGSGNLGVRLARETAHLVCVESNGAACDAARFNLAARGLDARVVEGDAQAYAWKPVTDLVVLDPPRAGARAVAERLRASRVPRVVYVSCDAQTLGRDLAILADAYAPLSIAAFEMFPQTSHVEIVVALERRSGL
jgi:23S rRNA (uracil1939-C5)-methyltransferase